MPNPDLILILDYALRAGGVPVDGVSVGTPADRATWHAQYASGATPAQKTQGDSILATIDVSDVPRLVAMLDVQAQQETNDKKIQAVAVALWECISAPTMTKPQLKARIVQIYKTL